MAMMAGLSQMMAPSMMGMAIGSMVGRLARACVRPVRPANPPREPVADRAPRRGPFAADWSLPVDEMRLWVLAQS